MRTLLLIPVGLAAIMLAGFGLCKAVGADPHVPQMTLAAVLCLIGSIAAALPLWFARRASQLAMSQAALVSTMLHMFVTIAGVMIVMFGKVAGGVTFPLVYWLMACFAVTLAIIATACVIMVRSAKVEPVGSGSAGRQ